MVELDCGHTQHLRHQPPWQDRGWVEDPLQRQKMINQMFACGWCQRLHAPPTAAVMTEDKAAPA